MQLALDKEIQKRKSQTSPIKLTEELQKQQKELDLKDQELEATRAENEDLQRQLTALHDIAINKLQPLFEAARKHIKEDKTVEIVENVENSIQMTWNDAVSIMNQMRSVECTASIFAESFTAVKSDESYADTFTTLSKEAKDIKGIFEQALHTAKLSPSQQIKRLSAENGKLERGVSALQSRTISSFSKADEQLHEIMRPSLQKSITEQTIGESIEAMKKIGSVAMSARVLLQMRDSLLPAGQKGYPDKHFISKAEYKAGIIQQGIERYILDQAGELEELQVQVDNATKAAQSLKTENDSLKTTNGHLQAENTRFEAELKTAREKMPILESDNAKLKELEIHTSKLANQLSETKKEHEAKVALASSLERILRSSQKKHEEELKTAEKLRVDEVAELKSLREKHLKSHQQAIEQQEQSQRQLNKNIRECEGTVDQQLAELRTLGEERLELEEKLRRQKEALSAKTKMMEKLEHTSKSLESENDSLKAENDSLKTTNAESKLTNDRLQERVNASKQLKQDLVSERKKTEAIQKEINLKKLSIEDLERRIAEADKHKRTAEQDLGNVRDKNSSLQSIISTHDSKMKALKGGHRLEKDSQAAMIKTLEQQLKDLQEQNKKTKAQLQDTIRTDTHQKQCQGLNKHNMQLQDQLTKLELEHNESIDKLVSTHNKQLQQQAAANARDLKEKLASTKTSHDEELGQMRDEYSTQLTKHGQQIQGFTEETEKLLARIKHFEHEKTQHMKQLRQKEKEFDTGLDNLKQTNNAKLKAATLKHNEDLAAHKKDVTNVHDTKLASAKETYDKEIKASKKKNTEEVEALKKKNTQEVEALTKEHTQEVEALKLKMGKDFANISDERIRAEEAHSSQLESYEQKFRTLEKENNKLTMKLDNLTKKEASRNTEKAPKSKELVNMKLQDKSLEDVYKKNLSLNEAYKDELKGANEHIERQNKELDERKNMLNRHFKELKDCRKQLEKCKAELSKREQVVKTTEKPKKVEQPVKIQQESKRASPWLPVKGPRKEVRELQGLW